MIDCERLTHDIVHKVATILTHDKQHSKKHAFHFPICSECFNEVTFELSQLEKANQHKKLRKLDSTYIEVFKLKSPKQKSHPQNPSPGLPSVGRRALKHFGSFHVGRTEHQLDMMPPLHNNKFYDAAAANNLHHIPAIEELSLDLGKLKLNDNILTGIVDSVPSFD